MSTKLIVSYIGDKCSKFLPLSFDSIINYVDKIIFVWGMEEKKTEDIVLQYQKKYPNKIILIESRYKHEYQGANGFQRNIYLKYLQKNYDGAWNLTLDPDEVVDENIKYLKERLYQFEMKYNNYRYLLLSPKMIHLINTLGEEDATRNEHFCPHRLFKIHKNLIYPEQEHSVLQVKKEVEKEEICIALIKDFTIYHLAYCEGMFSIRDKIITHRKKSKIHSSEFLDWWYHSHLSGEYPTRKINILALPKILKDYFMIDEEYLYFKNRGIEVKHGIMVKQWYKHFKPKTVIDLGCGRGPYLFFWDMVCDAWGLEISDWAFNNSFVKDKVLHGNILDINKTLNLRKNYDLVCCIDVLEHLKYEDIDKALENIYTLGKQFLFSIPFKGNPNLDNDSTHIIKESKEWWIEKLKKHNFKIQETPQHFLFKEQIIIANKGD